jgi:hypothetical protein
VTTARLSLPTLIGRRTEIPIPRLLWKLAWLAIFNIAKKSLTYWTDGLL